MLHRPLLLGLAAMVLVAAPNGASAADPGESWLITPEEAAMQEAPPPPGPIRLRGKTAMTQDGPYLELISPPDGKSVPSPLLLQVKFAPNVAAIDVASLKVSLVKVISIDITNRLRPFTTPDGLRYPDAKIPSGKFRVRMSLADVEGHVTTGEAMLVVQ